MMNDRQCSQKFIVLLLGIITLMMNEITAVMMFSLNDKLENRRKNDVEEERKITVGFLTRCYSKSTFSM